MAVAAVAGLRAGKIEALAVEVPEEAADLPSSERKDSFMIERSGYSR